MPRDPENPLDIDEERLDQEWVRQPRIAYWAGEKEADAQAEVENYENLLKLTEAELQLAIRSTPSEFDLTKVTDETVKMAVRVQQKYKDAQQALNHALDKFRHLKAMTNAIEHKKRALEKLVDLKLMNWRSEPKASVPGANQYQHETTKDAVRRPVKKKSVD